MRNTLAVVCAVCLLAVSVQVVAAQGDATDELLDMLFTNKQQAKEAAKTKVSNAVAAVVNPVLQKATSVKNPVGSTTITTVVPQKPYDYPTPSNFSLGTCIGWSYCWPQYNLPVTVDAQLVCPAGFTLTTQTGRPFCQANVPVCPTGYDLSSKGECCAIQTSQRCYAALNSCPLAATANGKICAPDPLHSTMASQVTFSQSTNKGVSILNMLMPKLDLSSLDPWNSGDSGAKPDPIGDFVRRTISAAQAAKANNPKDLIPKCFNKCCESDQEVVCSAAKTTVNYATVQYVCPKNCAWNSGMNKCLCAAGRFDDCPKGTTVCKVGQYNVCSAQARFFNVPACTFITKLQDDLPKVDCP